MSQAALAEAAGVSRRWLSALESGKATAEIGLVLRTTHALGLVLSLAPEVRGPHTIDLDEVLKRTMVQHD